MAWQLDFSVRQEVPSVEFLDAPKPHPLYGISTSVTIDPTRMPTQGRLRERWSKPMPDIFRTPGLNAFSQRLHDLVERFEPGMHQFFPLKLFRKNDDPLDDHFYIFNCAVGVDAIVHSSAPPAWATDATGVPILRAGMGKRFEISRPAIGDHHLWCGKTVAQKDLFASDAFYEEIERENITGFDAVYRKELDVPWIAEKELAPLLEWEASRH